MPQSLTQLPEMTDMKILGWEIKIRNHNVLGYFDSGLFAIIMGIMDDYDCDRKTLYQLEKHGISYEAAIECCVREIEHISSVFTGFIWRHCEPFKMIDINVEKNYEKVHDFSESVGGRMIADQIVEKIRSCENWGELYDELHMSSRFQKEMENRIKKEIKT